MVEIVCDGRRRVYYVCMHSLFMNLVCIFLLFCVGCCICVFCFVCLCLIDCMVGLLDLLLLVGRVLWMMTVVHGCCCLR